MHLPEIKFHLRSCTDRRDQAILRGAIQMFCCRGFGEPRNQAQRAGCGMPNPTRAPRYAEHRGLCGRDKILLPVPFRNPPQ